MGPTPKLNRDRVASHAASRPEPPAVVCDVSFVNGLTAVRSLGRMGVPVFAVDPRPSALGFRSRYAFPVRSPDPFSERDAYVGLLLELAQELGAGTPILPTHDPPLNAIAQSDDVLGGMFTRPFPGGDVVARVQSKRAQLECAIAAGVDIPTTSHPASADEARDAARETGFPVLLKPSDPDGFRRRFRRQAFRCETPDDVARAYADAEPFAPMVQELIPGGDDELFTVGSYIAADGTVLGTFCGRKLRQTPPGVGTCRVGEARWVPEVVEAAFRLLRAIGFHGVSQVEFKRDPRDGRYKLMEINPRLWQWHGLAAALGVDFPRIAYLDLAGRRPEPVTTEGRAGHWALTFHAGETPVFVRPPYVDPLLAVDDPKPGLAYLARVAKAVVR